MKDTDIKDLMSVSEYKKIYNSFGRFYLEKYNSNAYRIIYCKNFSDLSKKDKTRINSHFLDSDYDKAIRIISNNEKSIQRSKRNIRRISLSNSFEYFATWTINAKFCNRWYIEDVVEKMRKLLKAFQRVNKDFKYIYIIEKHENGAFHFHGLIKGIEIGQEKYNLREYVKSDYDRLPRYILDCFDKGVKLYHIPFFDNELGYNTFSKIKHYNKCCNYITKYITEDMQRIASNYIYFSSRGLSKGYHCEVAFVPDILLKDMYKYYVNDDDLSPVAQVKDLYIDKMSKEELEAFDDVLNFYCVNKFDLF